MRPVAALYIDPLGVYPKMPGVDHWDEARDARLYDGPHPVVAHPPCGPWSKLRHLCNAATMATADCAPRALEQVRRWGGVLEHPAHSLLFQSDAELARHMSGRMRANYVDAFGGFCYAVNQVEWGHVCSKPTWIYMVGVPGLVANDPSRFYRPFPNQQPTHCVCTGPRQLKRLPVASKQLKRRTPPLFAQWLVSLARSTPLPAPPKGSTP
jgi:hypothetical protein